jgi:hypothetical protein
MGVYVDNSLRYVVNGTKLNTSIALTPGKHNGVVQEWDYCCGATKAYVPFSVAVAGGVYVTSPTRRSTIAPLANYVASATSTCPTVNYEMDGDRYQTATTSYVDKLNLTYE